MLFTSHRFISGVSVVFLLFMFCTSGVENDANVPTVDITVFSAHDSSTIENANVIIYNANTNEPVNRAMTRNGHVIFILEERGTYYLRIEAQGYEPVPTQGGVPLPFEVINNEATAAVYMAVDQNTDTLSGFGGYVKNDDGEQLQGVLVTAAAGGRMYSGTSGPDGYFVFFNIPPGVYTLEAHTADYLQSDTPVTATVSANSFSPDAGTIVLLSGAEGQVTGHVAFVAASNPDEPVDVTLIHPETREAIPGLATTIDETNSDYAITGIPYEQYIAWASYRNDGYVMDPDAIRKFGIPTVRLSSSDPDTSVDFKVTGAIKLVSPTNTPDSVYPVEVSTTTPTFVWVKTSSYSSAKEYIIEVFDSNGRTVWGGFDADGTIRHTQIPVSDTTSVVFNFDGSAVDSLAAGEVYRWKVYADDDRTADVQTLLSASEDLMGLFKIVEPD